MTDRVDLDDLPWALERVQRLCASAYVDASVYRTKLLKGFGYPNETFRAAQDARALSIVLAALQQEQAARAEAERERDKAREEATRRTREVEATYLVQKRLTERCQEAERERDEAREFARYMNQMAADARVLRSHAESRCRELEQERDEVRADFESLMRIHTALTADAPPEKTP